MNLDNLDLFVHIMQAQNVPCYRLETDFSNLYQIDLALRGRLYTNYNYQNLHDFIISHCHDSEILRIKDDFNLVNYFILIEDTKSESDKQNFYISVGPVLETLPTPDQIHQLMIRRTLPQKLLQDLQNYYCNITIPPDFNVFESTLINIACHLFSRDFKFQIYSDSRDPSIESVIGNSQLNENPFIAIQSIEERYETEENLLEAIAAGDHARAILYHGKTRNFKIMPRSENTLINRKNLVIVLNTLCRKAVQKGHVHPMYIDDLSTRFAIQINQIRSLKELDTLESDMIHKYCLLVYNHSMKNYSQIVQQCITYTDFHYAEPLTLAFFAERCHVTKSYLSSLFKKETGRNLTDYIHSVRISHSLFLLNSTQMPIHIVAVNCGYNDINYFIKLFKRLNGISPKQYRIQLRNN